MAIGLPENIFLTRLDAAANWARSNSLWPMPFATACCGIELMATAASRHDLARFGAEVMRFSPRQCDLLIVAGRVVMKMLPVLQRIWLQMPEQDGQPADVVIGQRDFTGNSPNVKGVGHPPSAQSLNWPYGVFSDGERLWVADTGNRRVLFYEKIPTEHFTKADKVIGKPSFEERDYDHQDPIWPYSVKVGPNRQIAITDTQYYRVLLWNDWARSFENKADVIIGQPSFESNGQNQFGWFPGANTLNWCYDCCFYRQGLWVADTGNSRILWFENIPGAHNQEADNLLGQNDFNTGSENKNTIWSTEGSLYWPFQVCIENKAMVVADTGNHRLVELTR